MNSRERVLACLNFENPDRAPRDLWTLPYTTLFQREEYNSFLKEYPLDIGATQSCPGIDNENENRYRKKGSYKDEWGSVWYVGEPGVVGEVKEPLIDEWSKLKSFKPPYEIIRDRDISFINDTCQKSEKFMLSDVTARPFERLQFLRGTEELYHDLAYGGLELSKLLEMVHAFYMTDIESWCQTDIDGIVFMDDWGTNTSLLINPSLWHEMFKPLYIDYCNLIHSYGKYAFFHTDGNVEEIFGDFIDIDVDAINSQLYVMDIEGLAKKYKGKITLWGELDRQHIQPFGTTEDVRKGVKRIRDAFDDGTGGVIAHCSWGKGDPTENIKAVYEAWDE